MSKVSEAWPGLPGRGVPPSSGQACERDIVGRWTEILRGPARRVVAGLELMDRSRPAYGGGVREALGEARRLLGSIDELLECLDAVAGHASLAPLWDLEALVGDVWRTTAAPAAERRIEVDLRARGAATLTGGDFRRWKYLLTHTVEWLLGRLPGGSAVGVEVGAAASSHGHRWLQATIRTAIPGTGAVEADLGPSSDTLATFGSVAVDTALRLMDGACYRVMTPRGPVCCLVAPVQG